MSSRRQRAPALALIAAAGVFAGCAVLTIDVDVYKGPLVNDPDVQIEQVAVMAIGAKPLLTQLRDRLEARHFYRDDPENAPRLFRTVTAKDWYKPGFIEGNRFTDDRAAQVNVVLSLYDDSGDSRTGPFLTALAGAARDYQDAYRALFPPAVDAQRTLDELRPAFVPTPAGASTRTQVATCAAETTPAGLSGFLRQRYEDFLREARSVDAIWILRAHRCLFDHRDKIVADIAARWPGSRVTVPNPTIEGRRMSDYTPADLNRSLVSQEAQYQALAAEGMVELHALLLFSPASPTMPPQSAPRDRFVEQIRGALAAWPQARDALAREWRAALDALALYAGPASGAQVRRLAHLASQLVEPHLLTAVLDSPAAPAGLSALKARLGPSEMVLGAAQRQIVRAELEELLVRNPAVIAAELIRADRLARESAPSDLRVDARFASSAARRYGLVRAPRSEQGDDVLSEEEVRSLTTAALADAAGFERGRIPSGLETLITSYRTAAHAGRRGDTQRQLLDELVGFAQKVLFVANFSLLVDSSQIREDGFLLQAVGNALLTQVDELKHAARGADRAGVRAVNDDNLRKQLWEAKQNRQSAPIECRPVPGARADLAASAGADPDAAKRVLDCMITELRLLHLNAVKEGGAESPTAKHLQEALRTALDYRSRLVQIRPASAFLRNSYPVTSLQKQSTATWNNMLSQHGLRQFGISGDSKEAARAIQEFDKQFWQNVNTVRLAGAGRTNYVVTKDDVGNWYVKNFSSDPEAIIKATKSLALYAAGGSVSAGAIDRASKTIEGKPEDAVKPAPAPSPLAGQVKGQEDKAKDRRVALATDVRQARPRLRSAIAAELALRGNVSPEQFALVSTALDLAAGDTGCLREPQVRPSVLDDLADLKKCRDDVLLLIDDAPIHAEIKRRAAARLAAAVTAAQQRQQALDAAVQTKADAERELGVVAGDAANARAAANAADAKAANAPAAEKEAALKLAGEARRLVEVKAGEQAALKAKADAASSALPAAEKARDTANDELQAAQEKAQTPVPALASATRLAAQNAVITAFRNTAAPLIAELENVIRDHQTGLRALLP